MTVGIDAVLKIGSQGFYDFAIDSVGDIETEDFFDTALLLSFFAERRASASEVPDSQRRRGWIGNESTPGFEIGSKIWLFEQARVDRNTLNGIVTAAEESLQWMIEDKIAISVKADAVLSSGNITLNVEINRPNSRVEKRFFELWNNTGQG